MKSQTTIAKKLTSVSLFLLPIPFLFFAKAFLQNIFNISLQPRAWLEKFSQGWTSWLSIATFAFIMILLPLTAVILNLLSLIRLRNNNSQTGIKLINFT